MDAIQENKRARQIKAVDLVQDMFNRTSKTDSDMTVILESIHYAPEVTIPTKYVEPIFQLNRAVAKLRGFVMVAPKGEDGMQFVLSSCPDYATKACNGIVKVMNKLAKRKTDNDDEGGS